MRREENGEQIAAEIKSFIGRSEMADLELAVGQFLVYRAVLTRTHPAYILWLAVSRESFDAIFANGIGAMIRLQYEIKFVVIDVTQSEVVAWLP